MPKAGHEVHVRPMRLWLETELAALRLERNAETLARAEPLIAQGKREEAQGVLRSTCAAAALFSQILPDEDDFATYQNSRRKELLENYCREIERVKNVEKGIR